MAGSLGASDAQLMQNRAFLVAFARQLIGVESRNRDARILIELDGIDAAEFRRPKPASTVESIDVYG